MHKLTKGALDRIMKGEEIENPIFQILGHKKLSGLECYQLFTFDGVKQSSSTILATQLNPLVTDNILSKYSIVKVSRYDISTVNDRGTERRLMVILSIEVLTPGQNFAPDTAEQEEKEEVFGSVAGKLYNNVPKPSANNNALAWQASRAANNLNDSISIAVDTTPIAALTPYQKRCIKARVANKTAVRTWSNSRISQGKLFSMDFIDKSGEIRCTAFQEECEKFHGMIQIGKVYYISDFLLKSANKQFNTLKNDYEMTLNHESKIDICTDIDEEIPNLQFNFLPIKSIENAPEHDLVDVLGIVKNCSDLIYITASTIGEELRKRDVIIVDENNDMVTITLWGTIAVDFDGSSNPVIVIKSAKINNFQGRKILSFVASSTLQIDPDIPQAHRLRDWYRSVGVNQDSCSSSKTLCSGEGDMNASWEEVDEYFPYFK